MCIRDRFRKVVGEIIYIDESLIKVLLVGDIVNNKFIFMLIHFFF